MRNNWLMTRLETAMFRCGSDAHNRRGFVGNGHIR